MPSHLILDIGNVLCRWDGPALLASVFDDPADREQARSALVQHPDWVALDAGTLTVTEAAERAATRCEIPASRFIDLLHALPPSLQPFPDIHDAVIDAQQRGVPVYILSNMHAHSWDYLWKTYPVFAGCRGIVVSCDIQLTKPDAAIYQHLTTRFSLEPRECVFVDDMPENIDAARNCGWAGEVLDSPGDGAALIQGLCHNILEHKAKAE